jgi:DNA-binding NarL/FixJ family response regulator
MEAHHDPVRVLCIDDHPMIRDGVATLLSPDSGVVLAGESSDVAHGVEQIQRLRPDVVLTDFHLSDGTALDVIAAVRLLSPGTRVIVFTDASGDLVARRALDAGAAAWLLKRNQGGHILDAIHGVMAGRQIVDEDVLREIEQHRHDATLSEREIQVLRLVSCGLANREIARRLSLTEGTVKNYLAQILGKFGAEDRTHAVVLGMRRGAIALS